MVTDVPLIRTKGRAKHPPPLRGRSDVSSGPTFRYRGERLEGIFAEGCSSLRDSGIHQGRAESMGTVSWASLDPAGNVSKDPRVAPT
jgi:hypothetical protein